MHTFWPFCLLPWTASKLASNPQSSTASTIESALVTLSSKSTCARVPARARSVLESPLRCNLKQLVRKRFYLGSLLKQCHTGTWDTRYSNQRSFHSTRASRTCHAKNTQLFTTTNRCMRVCVCMCVNVYVCACACGVWVSGAYSYSCAT